MPCFPGGLFEVGLVPGQVDRDPKGLRLFLACDEAAALLAQNQCVAAMKAPEMGGRMVGFSDYVGRSDPPSGEHAGDLQEGNALHAAPFFAPFFRSA